MLVSLNNYYNYEKQYIKNHKYDNLFRVLKEFSETENGILLYIFTF